MICVRCAHDTAALVATAPDGSHAWEIYHCSRCNFTWRSTEDEEITNAAKFNPRFKLDRTDLDALPVGIPLD